jgi:NADPH2:quinone reductase
MKGIRVHEYGGPEVMHLEDLPMPALDAGTVRIKAQVIGVNYVDIYQRSGQHHLALPFTPGVETAGLVDAVGGGVAAFKPGDRVIARLNSGAYAEYAVAPADKVVQVPDDLDLRLAITGLTQGMTAHYLSHDTFPLQPARRAGSGG